VAPDGLSRSSHQTARTTAARAKLPAWLITGSRATYQKRKVPYKSRNVAQNALAAVAKLSKTRWTASRPTTTRTQLPKHTARMWAPEYPHSSLPGVPAKAHRCQPSAAA
jgi:hypothetical protein